MKIKNNQDSARNIVIFIALFYAYTTRSILARLLYETSIQLLLYYGVAYILLGFFFLKSFRKKGDKIIFRKVFLSLILIILVIIFELLISRNIYSLLYYGLALFLPFSINDKIISATGFPKFCVLMSIFYSTGCIIQFTFSSFYQTTIFPLFTNAAQQSLIRIDQISAEGTYFSGFTSQVGYTSFYICIGIGALICFRKILFKKYFYFLLGVLMLGLLLTGKRGPVIFLCAAVAIIYFIEGYGKERFFRLFAIIVGILLLYILLTFLAKTTDIEGIQRIYESVTKLLMSGSIEDAGRIQLYEKAIFYFKTHPLIGIGWSNFKSLYTFRDTHVHCIYLQLLCETGIIGFSIFMSFFISRLISTIKKIRYTRNNFNVKNNWLKFSLFIQSFFLLYGIAGNPLYDIEETIFYFFAVGISLINFNDKKCKIKKVL